MRNHDNPSTTFFWNDWDNEPGMKFCGLAAQGLWVKMLSLAARSREYGVVLIGDHPSLRADLPALLASSCGSETIESIGKLVDDLVTFKVASVDESGRVFNRRMVAEAELSAAKSEAGRKGADVTNSKRQKSGKGVGKQVSKTSGKAGSKTGDRKNPTSLGRRAISLSVLADEARQNGSNDSGKTSPSSFFTLSSVSKDTGADAPVDKVKVTFGTCLAYLVENGQDEKSARALLGRWRRDHGDEAVHLAVDQARVGAISDPVPYIQTCLAGGGRRGIPHRADGWEAQP
jgi:hypothetical protein